jgi:hypothetical protein
MIYDRHEIASVNHKGGLALQIAVQKADLPMILVLLSGKPSDDTFAAVFPLTKNLQPVDRYAMVEALLSTGASGTWVHQALQDAISERPPRRDERLIGLLLQNVPDANFNDGGGLFAAVGQHDVRLLTALLKKGVAPQTAASVVPRVMQVEDHQMRFEMTRLLLLAGASIDVAEISKAMLLLLAAKPVDVQLLMVMLQQGNADVNFQESAAVVTCKTPIDN